MRSVDESVESVDVFPQDLIFRDEPVQSKGDAQETPPKRSWREIIIIIIVIITIIIMIIIVVTIILTTTTYIIIHKYEYQCHYYEQYMCIYIYIYIVQVVQRGSTQRGSTQRWILCRGGCSRRGVQWMGAVLHSKTAYNRM